MKQYVIDGLRLEDVEKLKCYCNERFGNASLGAIYWVEIPESILNEIQMAHRDCAPHFFTIELDGDRLSCEFLVRIKKSVKCDCMAYADQKQREWIMDEMDAILDGLDICI